MTEDRLVDIEIKLTQQEDAVEELNKAVYRQQKKIDQLEALCEGLIKHIQALSETVTAGNAPNEKPPHY